MIIIGSRGSALALAQTEMMKRQILSRFPDEEVTIKIIKTAADKNQTTSIRSGSSIGVFVKELEQALLKEEVDLAVHSMKDLPTSIPAELRIAAVPEREDARDAFISNQADGLMELHAGSLIGTGSVRRQSQILAIRPDLKVKDIRGNVDTRLNKLQDGAYDAIILACAGLNRLGFQNRISSPLSFEEMLPAPGQGALALEARVGDSRIATIAVALNHPPTAIAVSAERSFLRRMGGGCNVPVAVYAHLEGNLIAIEAMAASPDGKRIIRESSIANTESADDAAVSLADRILDQGGREILAEIS